jgi:hypothetical protein
VSTDDSTLRAALNALAAQVVEIVRKGIETNRFAPDEVPYFRWKLTGDLKYGPRGIESKTARGETFSKKIWLRAPIEVYGESQRTAEFRETVEAIARSSSARDAAEQSVTGFTLGLARRCFEAQPAPLDAGPLVEQTVRDLAGEAFRCGAEISLHGLSLESDEVRPAAGIVIRRPTREDLEREVQSFAPFQSTFDSPDPTAIATIELLGTSARDVQRRIEKLITLLRLFKPASVQYSSYALFSDSVMSTFIGGMIRQGRPYATYETAQLQADETRRLSLFFQSMDPILPVSLYDQAGGTADYITIAYERYAAALTRPGFEEELLANAVMGLEALLVREGQEVAYRLRLRAAKLLSCLGEDPIAVSTVLGDAYGVRNIFSHGDRLSRVTGGGWNGSIRIYDL